VTAEEVVRLYKTNIRALQRHVKEQSMDDAEYIRVVRVLIETAETSLAEIGQSDEKIETAAWKLAEFAKDLYVRFCLEQNPEIANKEDFAEESGELFDYVLFHGTYPE
jgi:2-hydroxy-3-keto-5-methylthiopentenyl-1-phosphate phosphatase